MDAADPARREDADARVRRAEHRPRDRRRAEPPAGKRRGEVAAAHLHRLAILGEPLDLRAVQPDDDPPIHQANRRGHRPRRPHRLLDLPAQVARLSGYGKPCEMIVDSSATTGFPAATAARTSSRTASNSCMSIRLPNPDGTPELPKGKG